MTCCLKKIVIFSLALYGALVLLPRFCYERTGDFWFQTILSNREPDPHFDVPVSTNIDPLLSQRFHFLSLGMQSVAFLAEDGQTILKFFKHRASFLKKGRFVWQVPYVEPILESYKLAYSHLAKETGLLYIHLNKTTGKLPTVTLVDKQGMIFHLALDETEFVIQKRAELVCPTIRRHMQSGNLKEAKALLHSLVTTVKKQYASGLLNSDHAFRRNVGFVEGQAIFIDAGSFYKEHLPLDKVRADILDKGKNLEKWLAKHYPKLHQYYLSLLGGE